jgi:integrase
MGGRGSKRVQRGGFASERVAGEALERELERLRREQRVSRSLTLTELVEAYLEQHDVEPVTIEKLRWLLGKAIVAFGERPVGELRSQEIAAWRIGLSPGYRFDATQALRQVLSRAVVWGMIDVNPAKLGVDNPSPRRREQRPFESWAELDAIAAKLGPRYAPIVIFAAATGLRPGEWFALEERDVDREARVVYVRRAFTKGRLSARRQRRADGQCRYKQSRSTRSNAGRQVDTTRFFSPASGAATSTCTTSATTTGSPPNSPPGSSRCAGSTISDTLSPPSRSVLASPPSTSPATWAPA